MIVNFRIGDSLELKKKHPCGGNRFEVLFTGSDVKVRCKTCGREMVLPRIKLEKNIKSVIFGDAND
jgi:hypothetical protein